MLQFADANQIALLTDCLQTLALTRDRPKLIILQSTSAAARSTSRTRRRRRASRWVWKRRAVRRRSKASVPMPSSPCPPVSPITLRCNSVFAAPVPWLLGGAADLSPSTKTQLSLEGAGVFEPGVVTPEGTASGIEGGRGSYAGRNCRFGIREHAMCAAVSGRALSGLRAHAASFFVPTDCCRGSSSFGLSAPGKVVHAHFGFDLEHVLAAAHQQLVLHSARA